jgi:hypothetical protein
MTDLFGREVVLAPPSRVQAKAKGLMTLATSGRLGLDGSKSASLQRSLESSLMTRLDTAGSTLFKLTWKARRTPLGRRYLERAVSGRRTSGSGFTSVPTPQVHDDKKRGNTMADNHYYPHDLSNTVELSAVPTPNAMEGGQTSRSGSRKGELLMGGIVQLASVHTPNLDDCNNTTRASGQFGSLVRDVQLASVPDGSLRSRLDQLPRQAQLADSGVTATGGTPATKSTGQLDPDYFRWLMGLPTEFSSCADTAMQLLRKSRKLSSKRT